mmetsp:Transcript_24667/g.43197  ORF Transcript_24667/g.43197 Transcript_24667/m.43197 type:complete len:105 (+) Transcript_24667:330-644(+)
MKTMMKTIIKRTAIRCRRHCQYYIREDKACSNGQQKYYNRRAFYSSHIFSSLCRRGSRRWRRKISDESHDDDDTMCTKIGKGGLSGGVKSTLGLERGLLDVNWN